MDRGFFITWQTVRRQLAAMPADIFQLRLIHPHTHKPLPAESLWTGFQLTRAAMIRFLRLYNARGFDVYIRPYAEKQNAGYILLDLDTATADIIDAMRTHGHEPCVVLQTSPGRLQAWVRVSPGPLPPARATAIARHLAHAYGGDRASTDWCHLGRLAGFTNQKPTRRQPSGYPPWVRILHAQAQLATHGSSLLQLPQQPLAPPPLLCAAAPSTAAPCHSAPALTPEAAVAVYHRWLHRLHIPQRFPHPDWSIADLWIAKELLRRRIPADQVYAILRLGSPGFPRRHSQPQDYLARTLRRAARDLSPFLLSARPGAPCVFRGHHPQLP